MIGIAVSVSLLLRSGTPSIVEKCRGTTVKFLYRVSRNTDLPFPGLLSRRLHVALMRTMQEDQTWPYANPIRFHWRQLSRNAELKWHGKRKHEWMDAIRATKAALIHSENALVDGSTGKPPLTRSHDFSLYTRTVFTDEIIGEENGQPIVADQNCIWLDDWVLDNINHHYAGKIIHPYWHYLNKRPLASRLYEYLTFIAQANYGSLTINYETLCAYLPAEPQKRHVECCDGKQVHEPGCSRKRCSCLACTCPLNEGKVRQNLNPALDLLKEAVSINGRACQAITFYRWQKAANSDMQLFVVLGSCYDVALHGLHLIDDSTATQYEVHNDVPPSVRVATQFVQLLLDDEDVEPNDTDVAIAERMTNKHGLDYMLAILPQWAVTARKLWPDCRTMKGARTHWKDAVKDFEKRQNRQAIVEEENKAEQQSSDLIPFSALREAYAALPVNEQERLKIAALEHPSNDFHKRQTASCTDLSKPSQDMLRELHRLQSEAV